MSLSLIIRLIVQQVYFDSSVAVPKRKGPSMDPCTDMHACFVEELTETRARRVQTPALWSKARADEEAGGGGQLGSLQGYLYSPLAGIPTDQAATDSQNPSL